MIEGEPSLAGLEPAEHRDVDVGSIADLLQGEPLLVTELAEAPTDSIVDGLGFGAGLLATTMGAAARFGHARAGLLVSLQPRHHLGEVMLDDVKAGLPHGCLAVAPSVHSPFAVPLPCHFERHGGVPNGFGRY